MTSTRLNPMLARLSFKLQPWMVTVVYLPGVLNTLADVLSQERPRAVHSKGEDRPTEAVEGDGDRRGFLLPVTFILQRGMWREHLHIEDWQGWKSPERAEPVEHA